MKALVEHFFRHEYGQLVASLSRRVGVHELERVEDAAQTALARALEHWPAAGVPDNPAAWLFSVAHNALISDLRKDTNRRRLLEREEPPPSSNDPPTLRLAGEMQDDLLRMLFVCCDDANPIEAQLALALKTLCGFSVGEIAQRLFASEASVYKRLARARERLRARGASLDALDATPSPDRRAGVRRVLYLLFTEGYLSSHAEEAIRRELCDEAIRLAQLLAAHPVGDEPETSALVALMHLHAARLSARQDDSGGLLLLAEQDRDEWDAHRIATGLQWLAKSARGDVYSRFHAEARIAAEHCLAPSFDATRWDVIAETYGQLERIAPSPLHRLNRAIAVAEWRGPAAGLALLEGVESPTWLAGSYLWDATFADLYRRTGDAERAERFRTRALAAAPNDAVRAALERRLSSA